MNKCAQFISSSAAVKFVSLVNIRHFMLNICEIIHLFHMFTDYYIFKIFF